MLRLIIVVLGVISTTTALNCFTCGVFLSAPEPMCRGEVRNNSCAPENLGCLSIVGNKADGTFYVEKRCAEKTDDLTDGCINIGIRGIAAKQCLCRTELCNSAISSFAYSLPMLIFFVRNLLF